MRIHPRAAKLQTESAFKVLSRAREIEARGKSVVHLEIGQPDFPTPRHICDAASAALRDGKTGYGPAPGLRELREAIAEDAGKRRGLHFDLEQVIVTPGAKPIIYYTVGSLAGAGDEVIYPDPGFPMYASIIAHSGAKPVPLCLREETGWRFDREEFRARVTDRTRIIILNSPNNPTGGVLDKEDLETIAEEAIRRDIVVLSDEIYINFLYDGDFQTIAAFPGMKDRTVILDGFSKTYSMTGWRLGYGIVPPELVDAFELYNVNIVSCAATFSQYGALEAIRGPQASVTEMVGEFRRRRDFLVAGLAALPGMRCTTPRGAFYAFPNIQDTGRASSDLAADLLEHAGVAVLAGNSFGQAGEGYLRLSYANSLKNLEEALRRMREFLERQGERGAKGGSASR
ncbi:MAG TPA: pyridoxal phosphate-dependent aminotransferase [Planctomycetota bacterium]|nr:pyridoxal phosphate-dependent aminotransferase [Planctomycetota bacterium]